MKNLIYSLSEDIFGGKMVLEVRTVSMEIVWRQCGTDSFYGDSIIREIL